MQIKSYKHPLALRAYWVIYAILLYHSGLAFTIWLMTPEDFGSGLDWVWLALFPVLLAGFIFCSHRLGCGSGVCNSDHCTVQTENKDNRSYPGSMPG